MQIRDFLETVITTPGGGYFNLASSIKDPEGDIVWREHWFKWPEDINEIVVKANTLRTSANVYFSAHLFSKPQSAKENVLPTRTIQADLDNADVFSLAIQPTVVLETSSGRYQAFWVLREDYAVDIFESLSRKLTYSIPYCDHSGWPLGHKFRIPHTFNYKYPEPFGIKVVHTSTKRHDKETFDVLPDLDDQTIKDDVEDRAWIDLPHVDLDIPPLALVKELRSEGKLSLSAYNKYKQATQDRSAALWQLLCECINAGIGRDLTYWVAYNSDNNKFSGNHYNATRDLRKDVLRAEYKVHNRLLDIKQAIMDIRKSKTHGSIQEKLNVIFAMILTDMRNNGVFHHTIEGELFYVPKVTGRPIHLSTRSDWLQTVLTFEYGLNSATEDFRHVCNNLIATIRNMPQNLHMNMLSYYDKSSQTLLLHSGARDIYSITPTSMAISSNGENGVLFQYTAKQELIRPELGTLTDRWHDILFNGSLETLINLTRPQAKALLIPWFLTILFRNACYTRPIMAAFGPPGSGKSTLMRIVYRFLYGRNKNLSQIGQPDDFDVETSMAPFVCYDNVDSWERWLPDRLAQATTASDVTKRKLYSDGDTVQIHRDTVLALTAHSPKFVREDIADRLLMINLSRRDEFSDESALLDSITTQRNALWGDLIKDIQTIIVTPYPDSDESPRFRIKDFSTFGLWVARALGFEADFREALRIIQRGQQDLVIAEELLLVTSIDRLVRAEGGETKGYHVTDLYNKLTELSGDAHSFQRIYRNAMFLSKKLPVMQEALKSHFVVKWDIDRSTGTRVWKFSKREPDGD